MCLKCSGIVFYFHMYLEHHHNSGFSQESQGWIVTLSGVFQNALRIKETKNYSYARSADVRYKMYVCMCEKKTISSHSQLFPFGTASSSYFATIAASSLTIDAWRCLKQWNNAVTSDQRGNDEMQYPFLQGPSDNCHSQALHGGKVASGHWRGGRNALP